MLILLLPFSLSWNFQNVNYFNYNYSYEDSILYVKNLIFNNMNDFFNDGFNITTFHKLFEGKPSFELIYEEKLDLLTNPTYKLFPNSLKITSYLNFQKKLMTIPEFKEILTLLRPQYKKYKSYIPLFGPTICNNLDIDYNSFKKFLEYVFVNKENDGIVVEKIFQIFNIPTYWAPQVSKILSCYDDIITVSDLFSKLNVLPQYYDFIEKVNKIKIPKNQNVKFFSITKIIDCHTSFFVLLDAVDKEIRNKYYEIKPLLPIFAPIDYQKLIENIPMGIEVYDNYMKMIGEKSPINVTNLFLEQVPLKVVVENMTKFYKAIGNLNYRTNLRFFFDYLKLEKVWIVSREVLFHITRDDSLCDLFNYDTNKCNKLYTSIVETSRYLVSENSFAKSVPPSIIDFYFPLHKSLSLNISDFLSYAYKLSLRNEEVKDVNFINFVNSFGNLFESITKYIERIDTRKIFLNSERAHVVRDLLKNNGRFELLIDPHLNNIVEMMKSAAQSYVDESTTIETVVKSIKPTTFLNFYQTFQNLGKVKSLKISRLADSIAYDNSSMNTNFDDVFPIKTIMNNLNSCKLMVDEMYNNKLYIETLSKCIGMKKEKLKDILFNNLHYVMSFMIGTIIGATRAAYKYKK